MSPWWLRTSSDESAHEEDFELVAEAEVAAADDAEGEAPDEAAPPAVARDTVAKDTLAKDTLAQETVAAKVAADRASTIAASADDAPSSELEQSSGREPSSAAEPSPEPKPPRRRRRRRRKPAATSEPSKADTPPALSSAASSPPTPSPPASSSSSSASPPPQHPEPSSRPPASLSTASLAQPSQPPQPFAEAVPPPVGEQPAKEIVYLAPERAFAVQEERKLAMFCDLENIALGVRDSEVKKFDVNLVLERLLEKGKLIVKKAYADWQRYSDYKRAFHESAIEMIDIPQKYYSGKNSADIKMVVDAMDLCYSKEHLDTFVILSGDSDFSPLVSKLKENDKYVIGIGVKKSSSNLLIANCDEFIYYEDVWRDLQKVPRLDHLSSKDAEVFALLIDAMLALIRENKEVLWGSMLKQTMKRKRPSFNEGYYGYSTFSELLQDAEKKKIVEIERDQRSGGLVVTGFATRG